MLELVVANCNKGLSEVFAMFPLALANVGEENIIKKIGGKPEVKKHLENLGFVVGGTVTVLTSNGGNIIVNVKEARVAVSKEMAQKIMI
jgi:ferrous iron transport protein A